MSRDTIIHEIKATKDIKFKGEKIRVKSVAKLYSLGDQEPYFSVTGTLYESRGTSWIEYGGGCCHDEILAAFPDWKPLVDLHLSGKDGAPMHAFANAWYHAGGCGQIHYTKEYWALERIEKELKDICTPAQIHEAKKATGLMDKPMKYWERWKDTPNAEHLASHLRIDRGLAESICNDVVAGTFSKDDMEVFVSDQRRRWDQEASDAIKFLIANKAA